MCAAQLIGILYCCVQQYSKTKIMLSSNKPRKCIETVEVQPRSFVTSAVDKEEWLP